MHRQDHATGSPQRHAGSDLKLTPGDASKLVRILGLLGSDQPGERDAAALAADRLRRSRGLTWDEIVRSPAPPPQPADLRGSVNPVVADLDLAVRHRHRLDEWPRQFVDGLMKRRGSKPLTPKQAAKLHEIADELRLGGCR